MTDEKIENTIDVMVRAGQIEFILQYRIIWAQAWILIVRKNENETRQNLPVTVAYVIIAYAHVLRRRIELTILW